MHIKQTFRRSKGKLCIQLSDFMKAAENSDFAMQHIPQPNPYIYYNAILKCPVVNDAGIKTIKHQLDDITNTIKKENIQSHAFVHRILSIYYKDIQEYRKSFYPLQCQN